MASAMGRGLGVDGHGSGGSSEMDTEPGLFDSSDSERSVDCVSAGRVVRRRVEVRGDGVGPAEGPEEGEAGAGRAGAH